MNKTTTHPTTRTSAVISTCGKYRYTLQRTWDNDESPACNFVMLNPSTADATTDDPTIRRCIAFARSWGYGRLIVTNLFAYRSTTPGNLRTAQDPVGPDNDTWIRKTAASIGPAGLVIAAWGLHGQLNNRAETVRHTLTTAGQPLHTLGLGTIGQPKHPLYIPATTRPQLWE